MMKCPSTAKYGLAWLLFLLVLALVRTLLPLCCSAMVSYLDFASLIGSSVGFLGPAPWLLATAYVLGQGDDSTKEHQRELPIAAAFVASSCSFLMLAPTIRWWQHVAAVIAPNAFRFDPSGHLLVLSTGMAPLALVTVAAAARKAALFAHRASFIAAGATPRGSPLD